MSLRSRLNIIVFYSNTKAGKAFDVFLLWAILLSVLTVLLESVSALHERFGVFFEGIEWFFTSLFTLEYLLRIYISPRPRKYILSFWGVIDFLAAIPSWLSFLFPAAKLLFVIRFLRFIRLFRILKLARFTSEARSLADALKSSLYKITIFFTAILILVLFLGTLMYVIEGTEDGFDSIPKSIYWAIITITTVGYGDLVPQTDLGKFIASFIMLIGYAIIAVPTGIVTAEISRQNNLRIKCRDCGNENLSDATFCSRCGEKIH
ncbi:ion transporter [Marinilabilia sp.]|uniref:ion transporter n=1 Tax=Marinilabilia sp. TaxID=2021252 RepID=UPI0025B7CF65|nr:ion transporter [Marinilabilia sp.]